MKEQNLYEVYTTKIFRVIPKNSALLVRNKFNGKSVKVKNGGFALLTPFHEGKLVSLAVRNFDYPKQIFEDADGQDVIVDLAVTVKVVDPIKFEYENTNVEAELKQLLESIMRALIKKHTYLDLSSNRFKMPEYSSESTPSRIDKAKTIQEELVNARIELNEFTSRNGLAIISLYNKSVEQTKEIQEAYNKKIIAEREAQAALISKNAELERAKIDAEILRTRAGAEADMLSARYNALINVIKDLPVAKQAEILKVFSLDTTGKTNVFMSVDGDKNVKAGMVAGAAMGSSFENTPKTR